MRFRRTRDWSSDVCSSDLTHCFPSEKLMDGLELMKNHKEPYCKVMVSWE